MDYLASIFHYMVKLIHCMPDLFHQLQPLLFGLIQYSSWPIVVFLIFNAVMKEYTEEIRRFIENIMHIKIGGMEFSRAMTNVLEEFPGLTQRVIHYHESLPDNKETDANPEIPSQSLEQKLIVLSPRLAILNAWDQVEAEMDRILENWKKGNVLSGTAKLSGALYFGPINSLTKITILQKNKIISAELAEKMTSLVNMRNITRSHLDEGSASYEQAFLYAGACREILEELSKKEPWILNTNN